MGDSREWAANGRLIKHDVYQDGQLNGICYTYYNNESSQLMEVGQYKLGVLDGQRATYYSCG